MLAVATVEPALLSFLSLHDALPLLKFASGVYTNEPSAASANEPCAGPTFTTADNTSPSTSVSFASTPPEATATELPSAVEFASSTPLGATYTAATVTLTVATLQPLL